MEFGKPIYLLLLVLVVPLVLFFYYSYRRGLADLKKLAGESRFDAIKRSYFVKSFYSTLAFILFFSLSIFALADLRYGEKLIKEDRRGLKVVFLIDVSKSMMARDISPSRIRETAYIIRSVVDNVKDGLFGVVLFSGTAFIAVPVTDDRVSVRDVLDQLDKGWLVGAGSNISNGLRKAYTMFYKKENRKGVVILISDGENRMGDPLPLAKKFGESGIPIVTVLVGTKKGATIPLSNGTLLRDKTGKIVVTKANPKLMQKIADLSHGYFISVSEHEDPELKLLQILKSNSRDLVTLDYRVERESKASILIFLGLIFLLVSGFMWKVKWKGPI